VKRTQSAYWAICCWLVLALLGYGLQPLVSSSRGDADQQILLEQALQHSLLLESENSALFDRQRLLDRYLSASFAGSSFLLIPARMTPLLDPAPRRSSARLDRGSEDGLEIGMGVIGASGVVGKIAAVGQGWSRVQLADDPAFVIPFVDESGHAGIFAGGPEAGYGQPRLRIDPIQIKDALVLRTHGGGGAFPEGLILGIVADARIPVSDSRILLSRALHTSQEILVLSPILNASHR